MHSPSTLPGRPPTKRLGANTTFRYIFAIPAVLSMPPSLLCQLHPARKFLRIIGQQRISLTWGWAEVTQLTVWKFKKIITLQKFILEKTSSYITNGYISVISLHLLETLQSYNLAEKTFPNRRRQKLEFLTVRLTLPIPLRICYVTETLRRLRIGQ